MIRQSDIIILSLSRWDAPISSPSFSLAKEFARRNRVFYIDHPFSLKDVITGWKNERIRKRLDALFRGEKMYTKPAGLPHNLTVVTPRMTLPINFLPDGRVYDWLSRFNDGIVMGTIRRIIADFNVSNFIYFNAFDPFFCREFPTEIRPLRKVYQSMDDLSQVDYTARHGIRLEKEIIRSFDVTLTTSRELRRIKSRIAPSVYYHPNAADFSIFGKALTQRFVRPSELGPAIGKKIIGYVGNIESRIDYELLKKIVLAHPEKMVVMVGPVTNNDHQTIDLEQMPNVIMVGARHITELPQYIQYFDCAIIPFKKNTLTRSIYPLKINEYLAAGRPVVTTDFSEDITSFGPVIYIGKDDDSFIKMIDQGIAENSEDRIKARQAVANGNTWEARVEQFWEILEDRDDSNGPRRRQTKKAA